MDIIKKNLTDILLFIGVFVVFFYSGAKKNEPRKLDLTKIITSTEDNSISITDNSQPIAPTLNNPLPPLPPIANPGAVNNIPNNSLPQANNPYAILMNKSSGKQSDNIKDSLGDLRGQAPSSEAIIERNSYFKKLSEQLKDLQGSVNSEEEKPVPTDNTAQNPSNDVNQELLQEALDAEEESYLGEEPPLDQ